METQERGFITGEQKEVGRQCIYICPLLFFLITLLLSVFAIVYNAKSDYSGARDAQDALKYLAHNLQGQIYEKATAVSISIACPTDYYVESIGYSDAIKSGCLCKDGTIHTKAYCLVKGSSNNCEYFGGAGSRDLQFWKSHKICVKKFQSWKFVHSKENCPTKEMKKCQSHVCVNGNSCPVSSIKIVKVDPGHQLIQTSEKSQSSFSDGHVFESNHLITSDPLVSLTTEFTNFPCVSDIRNRPQSESKKTYPLNKVKQEGCGEYGNIAAFGEKIDSVDYNQFYTENGLEFIPKSAPFYKEYVTAEDKISLFGVRRIPIKDSPECLNIEPGQVHQLVYGLYKVNACVWILAIFLTILSALGLLASFLFLTMRNKIKFLNSKKGILAIYILAMIIVFFAIILYACYCHYFYYGHVGGARGHFDSMIAQGCFIEKKFENAANETSTLTSRISNNLTWIIVTLFVFVLVWAAFYHLIMLVRKRKRLDALPNPAIL